MNVPAPVWLEWAWVQWLSPTVWSALETATARPDGGAGAVIAAGLVGTVAWAGVSAARVGLFDQLWVQTDRGDTLDWPKNRARHEAAHAVTIVAIVDVVVSLDIRCSDNRRDLCRAHLPDSMPVVGSLRAQMMYTLAGNAIDLAGGPHDQWPLTDMGCAMQVTVGTIFTADAQTAMGGR